MLTAEDFGVETIKQEQIYGGDSIESSAAIFKKVISGKGTEAQNNVVAANAGMAIATVKNLDPKAGFNIAKESLLSGKALDRLEKLIQLSSRV